MRVTLDLPLPPSANVLWRINKRTGKPYINPKYARWHKAAIASMWEQKPRGGWPAIPGAFAAIIHVPHTMRGDLDNRIKASLDFLQAAGIVANDKNCSEVTAYRADTVSAGRIMISVYAGLPDRPATIAEAA